MRKTKYPHQKHYGFGDAHVSMQLPEHCDRFNISFTKIFSEGDKVAMVGYYEDEFSDPRCAGPFSHKRVGKQLKNEQFISFPSLLTKRTD